MKIRFTADHMQFKKGDTTTVWPDRGRHYISLKVAEEVKGKAEKKADVEPAEKAAAPKKAEKNAKAGPGNNG